MSAKPSQKRAKRPKQTFIPGSEPPSIPAIDEAAEAYRDERDARMAIQKREVELQDQLLVVMHEHRLTAYVTPDGYTVTVAPKEKVSVRKKAGSNGEED